MCAFGSLFREVTIEVMMDLQDGLLGPTIHVDVSLEMSVARHRFGCGNFASELEAF